MRHLEEKGDAPYVVMELMDGGDLDELLDSKGGKLEREEALRILRQVMAGLEALHDEKVAHLDVKPQNVLLSRLGAVKLADFGISSRLRDQRNSRLGAGTPEYAPPEQLDGRPCDVKRRVDDVRRRPDGHARLLAAHGEPHRNLVGHPRARRAAEAGHVEDGELRGRDRQADDEAGPGGHVHALERRQRARRGLLRHVEGIMRV